MGRRLIYPWSVVDNEPYIDQNEWIKTALFNKGIPTKFIRRPDDETEKRIEAVYKFLNGSRNFILLVSNKTAYVNSLFYYLAATWMVNTSKSFDMVDLARIKEDETLFPKMEHTSLLMIPFNDSENYQLRNVRNVLGSILIKRQVKNMPTLIELYVKKPPSSVSQNELFGLLKNLASLYGDQAASTFLDKESNVKLLKLG